MIEFLPLGGADDIGSSCFYLKINNTGILLDCGIHPRKKGLESLPRFELIENEPLDFVIISHAHQDHIGALPFLIQKFPHVIVYSTYQTKEIAQITLHNAVSILSQTNDSENNLRIYTHEEIDLLVRSMRDLEYNQTIELAGLRHDSSKAIKVTLGNAGHILGAAYIILEVDLHKIIYTGDINLSKQTLMPGADISNVRNATTLIMETTYGAADSKQLGSLKSESNRFASSANKILHFGGSILIPVFALGKMQEILAMIFNLFQSGDLTETQIYTGGISREISLLYDRSRFIANLNNTDLVLREIPQQNCLEIDDLNYFKKNPGLVLASSGMMLKGTTSYRFLDYWLKQKSFAVFGVGYMDELTPGYRVMNSKTGESIKISDTEEEQIVHCTIKKFYFPSHSKREELLELVKFANPENVVLVHGDHSAKNWIGQNILTQNSKRKLYSAENCKRLYFQ
jgi:cleavage and polyadenylation specificity factor subunit 3